MRRIAKYAILFLVVCPPVFADDVQDREALRVEVEQLRASGRLSIGGIDIASRKLLAEIYDRREYSLAWSDPDKVQSLIAAIKVTESDGLHPADYHLERIEDVRGLVEYEQTPTPQERAALDITLTDSLIRLGYHQRFGKVNPYDLDPAWNFGRELRGRDPATVFQEAIDADRARRPSQ